jgi:restriction system protein
MPVPVFQEITLPMLRLASDGLAHSLASARERLADEFKLSAVDREERLPSGRQTRLANRVAWAKVYLEQAGLLSSPARGQFVVTDRGREVLRNPPEKITIEYLLKYPEFVAFRARGRRGDSDLKGEGGSGGYGDTPEEVLEGAFESVQESLARELLAKVKLMSPRFFEHLVLELLLAMGYGHSLGGAGQVVGKVGDGGIDGLIAEDRLGLDVIYLQAKRWDGTVGRGEIQGFVGALHGRRARKGVFLTTSTFSADARNYVESIDPRVVLIDGAELARLMVEHNVGVAVERTYTVKRIDSDFFDS